MYFPMRGILFFIQPHSNSKVGLIFLIEGFLFISEGNLFLFPFRGCALIFQKRYYAFYCVGEALFQVLKCAW